MLLQGYIDAKHSTDMTTSMWSNQPIYYNHDASAVYAADEHQADMVSDGIMCAAVRCEVLMQCCVRQLNDVMKWSDLIDRVVDRKDLIRIFHKDIKD